MCAARAAVISAMRRLPCRSSLPDWLSVRRPICDWYDYVCSPVRVGTRYRYRYSEYQVPGASYEDNIISTQPPDVVARTANRTNCQTASRRRCPFLAMSGGKWRETLKVAVYFYAVSRSFYTERRVVHFLPQYNTSSFFDAEPGSSILKNSRSIRRHNFPVDTFRRPRFFFLPLSFAQVSIPFTIPFNYSYHHDLR